MFDKHRRTVTTKSFKLLLQFYWLAKKRFSDNKKQHFALHGK